MLEVVQGLIARGAEAQGGRDMRADQELHVEEARECVKVDGVKLETLRQVRVPLPQPQPCRMYSNSIPSYSI